MTPHLTRRELLAGTAALATTAVGFRAFVGESVALTQAATAGELRFRWREMYNGQVIENSSFSQGDSPGVQLSLDNVMPGDWGSLTLAVSLSADGDPAALTLGVKEYENAENGKNEPEQVAPDPNQSGGELAGAINAECWFDTGILGISSAGGQNARRDLFEPLVVSNTNDSLADVAAALENGVSFPSDARCLGPGEEVVMTLAWSLPETTGNEIQGDSVSFTLAVTPAPCGREER